MNTLIAAVLLTLALAACGQKGGKEQGGKAEGQILPASVSDAMVPVDQVQSQPPLAPQSSGKKSEEAGDEADAAATDAPAAEEPAKPAPSPSPSA